MTPATRAAALAFLTAFVTLFMQVLVHRMVSAKLLNNYAFLVISLTMLGFAASGVLLALTLPRLRSRLNDWIVVFAALFAMSAIGVAALFYQADLGAQGAVSRNDFLWKLLRWAPLSLAFAVPFTFCGMIIGLLLSARGLPVRRIYCVDLLGSAVGAVSVLPAIALMGVEWCAVLACTVLLVGAGLLATPASAWARGVLLGAVAILALTAVSLDRMLAIRYPDDTLLAAAQRPGSGMEIEHARWDPLARVEVSSIPPPDPSSTGFASLIGDDRDFHRRLKLIITQNNYAFTYAVDYDGNPESLQSMGSTIYAGAYQATSVPHPRVLTIGVGGGYDILAAIAHDASEIIGVEISSATMRILTDTYRGYFRPWVDDPRVRLVQDDGRHFLETTDQRFDIIQLSEVGAYSGTAGAAHVFTENHLYTAEAFDGYLERLTPEGVLTVMRLEFRMPRIILRTLTTAVQALRRAGARRPADHIIILLQNNGRFGSMLVKNAPFAPDERQRVFAWASGQRSFSVAAAPGLRAAANNPYQVLLSLDDPQKEDAFLALYPFDVSPVDDDRPFFFRFSYWRHLFPENDLIRGHLIPIMEYNVVVLTVIVGLAAMLCVYAPLRVFAADGLRTPHPVRYAVYFVGTGVGYLAVEIACLQKFGLFLGHPNYALSVVLASLLFATGLGSLWSGVVRRALGHIRYVSYVLAGVILCEYALILPHLLNLIGLPFWMRCLVVVALIFPMGLCLGAFVPVALEHLKQGADRFVPWAWGINGIFSVLGPVLSVGFSMTWGINALLLSAILLYLAVGLSWPDQEEAARSAGHLPAWGGATSRTQLEA